MMIVYLIASPLGETFKIFMLFQVALSPGKQIDTFIFVEAVIIAIIDLVICIVMVIVGVMLKKRFKIGLKSLLRKKVSPLIRPVIT
jgi:hypothetical protein